jgi:hypothetical protein
MEKYPRIETMLKRMDESVAESDKPTWEILRQTIKELLVFAYDLGKLDEQRRLMAVIAGEK